MSTLQESRPEAGWYQDPRDPQRKRWWDGSAWTAYIATPQRTRKNHAGLGWFLATITIVAVVVVMVLWSGLPARLAQPGGPLIETSEPPVRVVPSVNAVDLASAYEGSVTLRANCGPGCGATGGAVAISADEMLTAAHVVVEGATVVVIAPNGKAQLARVIDTDVERDLALLQTAGPHGLPIVALRSDPPVIGEGAHAVGNPMGQRRISDGRVTDVVDLGDDGISEVQTDADIDLGNSGGPLLDDQGRLLGIVVQEHEFDDTIAWATSASDIAVFLASATRSGSAPASGQPLPGSPAYDEMLREMFDQLPD